MHRFEDIGDRLPHWLAVGISRSGFVKPSFVQSFTTPLLLEKHDLVGVAPTGSGKTVAFAIPALAQLREQDRRRNGKAEPSILVLGPTRELVLQTSRVMKLLAGDAPHVSSAFGGTDRVIQEQELRRGCEALVATPGRLCDFLDEDIVSLDYVDFLVIDEADRLLEMGFAPQLTHIMGRLNNSRPRQTMMWSATWSSTVQQLAKRFLRFEHLTVEVNQDTKTNSSITQFAYVVEDEVQRVKVLVDLYEAKKILKCEQTIIFVNQQESVDWLVGELILALRGDNEVIQGLHGGMRQRKRQGVLNSFRDGRVKILVATDVAARGLDVPNVQHVVNFDPPKHTDAYVHRIGRTGRAGKSGCSHTLLVPAWGSICGELADFMEKNGAELTMETKTALRNCRSTPSRTFARYRSHTLGQVADHDWRGIDRDDRSHGRSRLKPITLKRDGF
jgi:ATP-dependent RNA helicase DDX5/DBP2